ncbi:MAG: DUF5615 family PIN-like protein [Bacteroidetes bacterium]|nr:DUF5615 family PIN-like protein [Bacteroidota bacterium]
MRILLDECVTKHLKPHLNHHEVFTVREMQWSGIKNGKLMTLCVENRFDILLTIDKNLVYQQNLSSHALTVVIFNCATSKVDELVTFLPSFNKQILSFEKNKAS